MFFFNFEGVLLAMRGCTCVLRGCSCILKTPNSPPVHSGLTDRVRAESHVAESMLAADERPESPPRTTSASVAGLCHRKRTRLLAGVDGDGVDGA